jgi:hypothetical protein
MGNYLELQGERRSIQQDEVETLGAQGFTYVQEKVPVHAVKFLAYYIRFEEDGHIHIRALPCLPMGMGAEEVGQEHFFPLCKKWAQSLNDFDSVRLNSGQDLSRRSTIVRGYPHALSPPFLIPYPHLLRHVFYLLAVELGEHREGEDLAAGPFGLGKIALTVAQLAEAGLKVQR